MKGLPRMVCSFWLFILAFVAQAYPASSSLAYDGSVRTGIVYDGVPSPAPDYDSNAPLPENESRNLSARTSSAFVDFADFLAAKSAGGEMTSLYRAVNPAELADITANNGVFRNPLGIENKNFSTTAEGAASYARQTFGTGLYQGPYTIVESAIPSSSISPVMRATVDRGISTVTVPTGLLPTLKPGTALPFTPLPKVP